MSKVRQFHSLADVDELEESVRFAAAATICKLEAPATEPLSRLWELKATRFGVDPLDPTRPLNFIEQVNQSFTYLATAKALRHLFENHQKLGPFVANLGTASGSDIEGQDLAAEVFAATSPDSNDKLSKDIAKVSCAAATHRFVFLMCPGMPEGRQTKWERNGVVVWSVGPP